MWFVIYLILGVLIGAFVLWMRSKDVKLAWYTWLIGVVGLILLLFTIQNYVGSVAEFEDSAATMFLLMMGIPSVVLLAIAGVLGYREVRA
jgi:peptidoglycan/LPS O-acetylase OafA/YrhL